MTGRAWTRLAALLLLCGLFGMHGLGVGHDGGHCMAASTGSMPAGGPAQSTTQSDMPAGGKPAVATHHQVGVSQLSRMPVGGQIASFLEGSPVVKALQPTGAVLIGASLAVSIATSGCGVVPMGDMCVAVLIASLLLALLLAMAGRNRRRLLLARNEFGPLGAISRFQVWPIAAPSLSELCVSRT